MTINRRQFSRFALAALATGTALASGSAFGQGVNLAASIDPNGANWGQGFDPSSSTVSFDVDSRTPIAAPSTLGNIQHALDEYARIAAAGGWPRVPEGQTLRIGQRSPAVSILRQRLAVTGDIAPEARIGDTFDTFVQAGVVRFQTRHGILADGVVADQTYAELNVPVEQRIQQLRTNAARLQELGTNLGQRYIMVNIPGAQIEVVENGVVVQRHTAVVGMVDRPSPLLSSKVSEINFNPYWHAPESIVRRDIIPKMREDPEYLAKFNIRVYDQQGNEIAPELIDWNTVDSTKILLRQDPGDVNSMGFMKINFPNKHAVYLHDTPSQELFGTNGRFHSSGCVRVQNVRELAAWILGPSGEWSRSRIDQVIRTGERLDVPVASRPDIYFAYVTAWVTDEGMVNFRPDIYNRDPGGLLANET